MKRLLSLAVAVCLLLCSAFAEGDFVYRQESVTDCAQTVDMYNNFYAAGELSVLVPGLTQGFVPQGLSYLPGQNWMIIAGYSSNKNVSSVIFAVDLATGELVREAHLQYADGSQYVGHAGGVAVTEKNIFIANNNHIYRISLEKFLGLDASANCPFDEEIPVPSRSSYCGYSDGILWVGEFQFDPEYKTDRSHWYKNEDGRYKAWLIGYKLDQTQENELNPAALAGETATPDYIISTTERIQGMTMHDNQFYLSQSYGRRAASTLIRYQNVLEADPREYVELNGTQVPLWCLNKSLQTGALLMPPASECLVTVDGDVYVLFETAAEKYMDPKNPSSNPMDRLFRLSGF